MVLAFNSSILVVGGCVVSLILWWLGKRLDGWAATCFVVDDRLVFAYLIEWVFGDVPESSKETLHKEIILQNFPCTGLISEALGSITSWGSFLT